ncbi:MAG TPA: hypothetical protein VK453_23135, partial [Micromonosporaceae bacterium]|nr:hypothetical protein [Micromonosporaceae bacterium]
KPTDPGFHPGKPLQQLHDGRQSGHPTMIQLLARKSSQPADEHLISHHLASVAADPGSACAWSSPP